MMNKRGGDLLKNTLSIIIAVIGLGIFIFGVVRLYEVNKNQDRENAKRILDSILAKSDALQEGQEATFPVQWLRKWRLIGYGLGDNPKPSKCFFKSCLCMCPVSTTKLNLVNSDSRKEQADRCQKEGVCRSLDVEEIKLSSRIQPTYNGKLCFDWNSKKVIGFDVSSFGVIDTSELEDEKQPALIELFISNNPLTIRHVFSRAWDEGLFAAGVAFAGGPKVVSENGEEKCYFNYGELR